MRENIMEKSTILLNSNLNKFDFYTETGIAAGTYTITTNKKIIVVIVQDTVNTNYNAYLLNIDGTQYTGSGYGASSTYVKYNSDTSFTYKATRTHTLYYLTEVKS